MKKVSLILLVGIYSLAIMGFSLKQFYCCGKLKSITISLAAHAEKSGKDNGKSGCCDNKYQFFKVKDNHISADQIINPATYFSDLHDFNPYFPIATFSVEETTIPYSSHAPPLYNGVPVYISNCVFRI